LSAGVKRLFGVLSRTGTTLDLKYYHTQIWTERSVGLTLTSDV
jgi:hypothetical protein